MPALGNVEMQVRRDGAAIHPPVSVDGARGSAERRRPRREAIIRKDGVMALDQLRRRVIAEPRFTGGTSAPVPPRLRARAEADAIGRARYVARQAAVWRRAASAGRALGTD
jgi:hypothetical protein